MTDLFTHRVTVRFGECDPAGILYYPRYFDVFHRTMEAWVGEGLGIGYADLVRERLVGLPSVHAEADYRAPSHFGDQLDVGLSVEKLGRSSITFTYRVVGVDGVLRATGRVVTVTMDLDPSSETYLRAVPIPDDLRAAIEALTPA